MPARLDFLDQPAPDNYVAGLGRGATGFTTRSDLGPAREGPSEDEMKELLAKRAQQLGAAPPTAYGAPEKKDDDAADDAPERYQDPENEVGLFANGAYDRDDDEADRIYQAVDEKMERRRKLRRFVALSLPYLSPPPAPCSAHRVKPMIYPPLLPAQITDLSLVGRLSREAREQQEREEYERLNPKISTQFADLKRSLSAITDDEWASIPEVGDLTGRNKRARQAQQAERRYYAVPDSVITGAARAGQLDTQINDDGSAANGGGDKVDGTMTNFADINAAKDKVLKVRLDQAALGSGTDSVAGSATNIDPKGYLTSLSKTEMKAGEVEVGDINRVRVLLESVIKTNLKHAPGWIAAARLEEFAGKIVAARNVIARGCEYCPKSEDGWLENIRLNENHNARIIAKNALEKNDTSVRLWIEAMRLENDNRAKKRVLRRAIDNIPKSVAIWKEAVNLEEDPADARLLLAKATEYIPLSVELWLALARLESPENAQKVLNKARQAVPTSHEVWIAAARLQEQIGNDKLNVMKRAVQSLSKEGAMLKREEWIAEAEKCEAEGAVLTCGNIIRETLGYGLDEDDDRKEIWADEARSSASRDRFETARAIYAYALRVFPTSKSLWLAAADLERQHGAEREALWRLLEKAVEACPQSEALWMQLARERWQAGDIHAARVVLGRAFQQNPNNEDIWLAAVKLEADHGQPSQARELLAQARAEAGTDRVWIKSVAFERERDAPEAALDLVQQALQLFPAAAKLWMQKGQIYEGQGETVAARQAYAAGCGACKTSVPLWLLASRLEERAGALVRARSVLERSRLAVPRCPALWAESVRVERRAGHVPQAKNLMARALQECPNAGLLWSESIWHLEPRTQRKPRSLEAIRKVDNDPLLFVAVARIFWGERKLDKAAGWFEKAVLLDSDLGDTWAWYSKFLEQYGTEVSLNPARDASDAAVLTSAQEKRQDVLQKCISNEPKHGEIWQSVAKDPALIAAGRVKGVEDILKIVMSRLE